MKLIYQIGRLDPQMKILKFRYKGNEYDVELSSFALKRYFGNCARLVLIYPVSLPLNKSLINQNSNLNDELKKRIEKILNNKDEYLKNPTEFFIFHPHNQEANDFVLIHSIGEYEKVKFESSYDDIVLEILFDMIERYLDCGFEEIYIDISGGLNIYIAALLEAVRHFSIFNRLQNWNSEKSKIYKVFSEPIIGSTSTTYEIYEVPVEFKVFYSSPIKKKDIDNYQLSRKITESLFGDAHNRQEFKNKIQRYFKNFAVHFSAIKNATPLANYTFEIDSSCDIEKSLREIISLGKKKLYENWLKSPQLSKETFLKILHSLSFYKGIAKIFKCENINPTGDCGVSLEEIKKFKKVYEVFGLNLNITFLGNEIWKLTEAKDDKNRRLKDKVSDDWKPLNEFINGEGNEFNPRNFFAHAGFERTITEVRKCNEKLYFRYMAQERDRVKDQLKDNC